MSNFDTQEFIQDFLQEAGEHLDRVNANLLALEETLEPAVDGQGADSVERVGLVEELFRSFHTLKGLSMMMGLDPAARLSHTLEAALRAVQHAQIEVSPELVDRMLNSTRVLEQMIESVRAPESELPNPQAEIDSIEQLLPRRVQPLTGAGRPGPGVENAPSQPSPIVLPAELESSLTPVDQQKLQTAHASGKSLTLAIFTPSVEKSEQGINVNTVRNELLSAGELIKSVPLIGGNGVRFAFLMVSEETLQPGRFPELEWTVLAEATPALKEQVPPPGSEPTSRSTGQVGVYTPTTVRVELDRLDELMRLVSELVVTRSRLADTLPQLQGAPAPALEVMNQTIGQMERHLRDLRQATMRARMVPLSEVFNHMPLAVRDLARASGKMVRLVMEGEDTEVDRMLVERLLDPLLHLVRNAITHGIETPAERQAAGKPPQGLLRLRGQPEGELIRITLSDDGRGIDEERVAERALALNLITPADLPLSQEQLLALIRRPGFSTRGEADLDAGRGVGMDVVMRMVQAIGGSLSLETTPGQGTTFTLNLPLTLTIISAIIVSCGTERYAAPQSAVQEVIEIDPKEVVRLENGEMIPYRERSLALLRLSQLFHLPASKDLPRLYGLVIGDGARQVALAVDRLVGQQEVVRTMKDPLVTTPGITGATELGDGSVILILDIPVLFRQAAQRARQELMAKPYSR